MLSIQPILAQQQTPSHYSPNNTQVLGIDFLVGSNILMFCVIAGLIVYSKLQVRKFDKLIKFEQFKAKDLKKKLKLALVTIKKMETNPDLVHSREFNLDYLRMRMDEEMFHSLIVNRLKIKVSQIITIALRPDTSEDSVVGIAGISRKINEIFDVTYEIQNQEKEWKTRVLFRVQIKLTKLPMQSSSSTINQILDCIERYLSPELGEPNWQPAIQGHMVKLDWDQNAKPTPLLVLEQSEAVVNVPSQNNTKILRKS